MLALRYWKNSPSVVTRSPRHSAAMMSSASSTSRPRPSVGRPVAFQSGPRVLPIPNAGSRRPSLKKSMVAHCLARSSGSRSPTDATFIPNLIRRVAPASAAIALMHSRMGRRDTRRSVCQSESTPPASQRSTHRRNEAPEENGSSMRPSPTPIVIVLHPSSSISSQLTSTVIQGRLPLPGNLLPAPRPAAARERRRASYRAEQRGAAVPVRRRVPPGARGQALAEGRSPTRSRHAAMFLSSGSRGCPYGTKVSRFA